MIYRNSARQFTPWKNGGGDTAQIVVHPQDAGLDDFDWRISMARVAQSGPFSNFPNVTRILTVLEGGPMTLTLGGQAVPLDPSSNPFRFDGGMACDCVLNGDIVIDLNVMTKRPYDCRVSRYNDYRPDGPTVARYLFALVELPSLRLDRHDMLTIDDDLPEIIPRDGALVIEIFANAV